MSYILATPGKVRRFPEREGVLLPPGVSRGACQPHIDVWPHMWSPGNRGRMSKDGKPC